MDYQYTKSIPNHYSLVRHSTILTPRLYDDFDYHQSEGIIVIYQVDSCIKNSNYEIDNFVKEQFSLKCTIEIYNNNILFVRTEQNDLIKLIPVHKSIKKGRYPNNYLLMYNEARNWLVELYINRNQEYTVPDNFREITFDELKEGEILGQQAYLVPESTPNHPIRCNLQSFSSFFFYKVFLRDYYNLIEPGNCIEVACYDTKINKINICGHDDFARIYIPRLEKPTKPDILPGYTALTYRQLKDNCFYTGLECILVIYDKQKTRYLNCIILLKTNLTLKLNEKSRGLRTGEMSIYKTTNDSTMLKVGFDEESCQIFIPNNLV